MNLTRSTRSGLAFLVVVFGMFSCTGRGELSGNPQCTGDDEGGEIEDRELRHRFLHGIQALETSGGTATVRDLEAQMSRGECEIELAPVRSEAMSPGEIYSQLRKSVLIVGRRHKCERCSHWHVATSSGFVISADGAFVTNRHVIKGKPDEWIAVMTSDEKVHVVEELLAADGANDVVILKMRGSDLQPLALEPEVVVGEPVSVIGHPASHYYTMTRGIVSRAGVREKRGAEIVRHFMITADYARGSSGAPVFNERGAVVGIARETRSVYYEEKEGQQRNLQMVFKYCVPAGAVLALVR